MEPLDKFRQNPPFPLCMIRTINPQHLVFYTTERKEGIYMQTITQEYALLFNALTDAEEVLRQLSCRLISIQQQAEELFLAREDDDSAT